MDEIVEFEEDNETELMDEEDELTTEDEEVDVVLVVREGEPDLLRAKNPAAIMSTMTTTAIITIELETAFVDVF